MFQSILIYPNRYGFYRFFILSPLFFASAILIFLSTVAAYTEELEPNTNSVPAGMEIITLGATKILVPVGMNVQEKRGLIILEDVNTYLSREINALHIRLEEVEKRNQSLEQEVEEIKKILESQAQPPEIPGNNITDQ